VPVAQYFSEWNGFSAMDILLLDKSLWFGENDLEFLLEVALRSLIMFLVILVGLRILGKRGVKQLSVFELVVIIGLGSAAGDPMFYDDVGLLPAAAVFVTIITLYKLVTRLVAKSRRMEHWVEGRPVCLIRDGVFCIQDINKETVAQDEFFAELRLQGISQLGQVYRAYVETSGEISVFYRKKEDVGYGLPLLPEEFVPEHIIRNSGYHSCSFCGFTQYAVAQKKLECGNCGKTKWVLSSKAERIS